MSRFYEQNIDVILEPNGFQKHIKEIRYQYKIESAFVVSTPAARESGVEHILKDAGYDPVVMWGENYGDLTEPTQEQILEAYKDFAISDCDTIVAVGGGSIVDLGKGIIYNSLADIRPTFIAVPTTYSGAEITKGLMVVKGPGDKKPVYDEACRPDILILDSLLADTLPTTTSLIIAVDALTHCLEGAASTIHHPIAEGAALHGINLALQHLPTKTITPEFREAFATIGFLGSKAMDCALGHIHNVSFSIGKQTGLKHGELNTLFAPAIIEASLWKRNDAYQFVDIEKVLDIFEFYIDDWNLYERYLPMHKDIFVETAIANANYNSHPVDLDANDFRWVFDVTLQRAKEFVNG
jgi:alcohol dehydrogenase class IV